MKNSTKFPFFTYPTDALPLRWTLILGKFFLIIFVYHILKDLKDTLVITASDVGAEVIPFLKIWIMLPSAILASYVFSKIYQKYGREKTLYIIVGGLICFYALFAFCLYPHREGLHLNNFADHLEVYLPVGCKGFVSMIRFWSYTAFYLSAELWSMLVLSVLFWGFVNDSSTLEQAKLFYPMCVFTANCAAIISGQTSCMISQTLSHYASWQTAIQMTVLLIVTCGIGIMLINRVLSFRKTTSPKSEVKKSSEKVSFKDSIICILKSPPLLCIALLVIGFAMTTNLIEVVWKDSIKKVYPSPEDYNAYVNQLTSIIGVLAVIMSFIAHRIFKYFSWSVVAMITPMLLLATSLLFFLSLQMNVSLEILTVFFSITPLYLMMTLGSLHYVLGLTAKYTVFDMSKEMAFLSIEPSERMRAKSIIDSVGSRLGKSGSSCLYQILLIAFGSTSGNISIVGMTSLCMITITILATRKLGECLSKAKTNIDVVSGVT
jgi:ATP:ADP antiporter, AAA family